MASARASRTAVNPEAPRKAPERSSLLLFCLLAAVSATASEEICCDHCEPTTFRQFAASFIGFAFSNLIALR